MVSVITDAAAIATNLAHVKQRIKASCLKAGRAENEVRLLLATKTVPAEKIKEAIQAGGTLIGENKVQELKSKYPLLKDLNYEKHFIGHLQTNKIKDVLSYVSCIESVDQLGLAENLDRRLQSEGKKIDIFVQVNTSFEGSKFGAHPNDVDSLLKQIRRLNTLNIKGLMTIGLFDTDPERVRPSFFLLRQVRDRAIENGLLSSAAKELSMGMSGDLETAIEEGATIVRVGAAIFGQRPYPDSYYWNENKEG